MFQNEWKTLNHKCGNLENTKQEKLQSTRTHTSKLTTLKPRYNLFNWKKVKVTHSCPALCDPVDYTVHGILQARILEWVASPFSRESSQPRDWTQVSHMQVSSLPAELLETPYAAVANSLRLCPTLCDPRDASPLGSPVPGILQARTLEWVAISFSNAWKWKWSCSVVSDPQRPHGLQPSRLLCPWDFPGKSTGVGCHCLLWDTL